MEVLRKSIIGKYIVPHLSVGERAVAAQVPLSSLVAAILHRLKTGEQWRWLPVELFFEPGSVTWQGVYHHFHKWYKDGSFANV